MIINHGGTSGGKDSTALMLWMRYESGYPTETLNFSFCDTGNEAQETYDHVQMLSERVHPVEIIKPPRDFWELARWKKRFPGAKARFCTQELKMQPTLLYITALLKDGHEVLMHSGVRASESADRALLPEYEPLGGAGNYFPARLRRPLLTWTIEDVWAIHKRYGIPRNPLYDMGATRVGCLPCIMSRKAEIANIAKRWPERIDFIRLQERTVENPCGFSSIFSRDKVPDRYRNVTITTKAGEKMRVASIDDVVAWAQNDPSLYTEAFDFEVEEAPACDNRYGACE